MIRLCNKIKQKYNKNRVISHLNYLKEIKIFNLRIDVKKTICKTHLQHSR